MPDQKKKCQPPICMSPSRRLIIPSMEIRDIPQRVICVSSSLSTPTPSTSHLCNCNQDYCIPNACGKPQPPVPVCGGPHGQPTAVCPRTCKMFDGVMVDDIPCCQEMLRKLAQESLAFNQVEKRISIQEPHDPSTCIIPCCIENNPVPSTAICLPKSNPQIQPPPTQPPPTQPQNSCPGCQDTQRFEAKDETVNEVCSIDSCARDAKSRTNIQCSEECESKDKVPELQSSICNHCNNQQMRNMPFVSPIPSKNLSGNISDKSNEKLSGKLSKKEKKAKKEEKKIKKNLNEIEQLCNHEKCIANNPCPCRFPPAYNQYYNCTGQVSGNCSCGQNK